MTEANINSILAVDCGAAHTTAALIERVEGEFRLMATGQTASTYEPPWRDITAGVVEAVNQIEKTTDRVLLAPGGWPFTPQSNSRQGVDAFVVVSSAGKPLQVALVGLMQEISLASARRAAASTYTAITNVLSLDTELGDAASGSNRNGLRRAEARIQALLQGQQEVILLVGGTDGGAERPVLEMANILSMAMQVWNEGEMPAILYAGNSALRKQVAEILGWVGRLKSVDNVRPVLEVENLLPAQLELDNLYVEQKMRRLPGFEKLSNWSRYPATLAGKSFEKVIAYLGRYNDLNVIGCNIGSGTTIVATQTREYRDCVIRSDAGVGHSLSSLLKAVPVQRFHRWLSLPLSPEELYNQLLNKSLYPGTIPATREDLMIEHAIAREALRLVVEQARASWPLQPAGGRRDIQWNLIVGGGRSLTRAPQPAQAAMIMLDGVEPWGVTSLALDVSGTANMLGAIAAVQPMAAVEVALHDAFLNLGTVVAPIGHGAPGNAALRVKINFQAADQANLDLEVPYGSIELVALPPGAKATLEIRPTRHFDIGLGQPGRGAVAEVEGGILGLIIDARGRPLRLPPDDEQRQELLEQWLSSMGISYAAPRNND